jgi:hypothetical protein
LNLKVIVPLLVLVITGCSSVPTVKLNPAAFSSLKTVKLESSPDNNLMLHSVSTVDMQFVGVGFATSAGDGKGVRELALEYMEQNNISLNELVRSQFKNKVESDNLPIVFQQDSPNKLVLTLNVVVLGMKHGFSNEFNALFNISGQLLNEKAEVVWSYNAIPMPPAPGYPATLNEMFASPEAFIKYLSAASDPMVQKLYNHFKSGIK